jgi:hypothetical protein
MKQKTFFGLALLFPYMLWVFCALVVFILSSRELSATWNSVLMPFGIYTFGIVLWFIPYTLLAIGMWVWSRNKPIQAIFKAGLLAPFFLVLLVSIEVIVFAFGTGGINEIFNNTVNEALALGIFSLIFGYLCVGVVLGLYKFLLFRNIVKEETTLNNEPSPTEV